MIEANNNIENLRQIFTFDKLDLGIKHYLQVAKWNARRFGTRDLDLFEFLSIV